MFLLLRFVLMKFIRQNELHMYFDMQIPLCLMYLNGVHPAKRSDIKMEWEKCMFKLLVVFLPNDDAWRFHLDKIHIQKKRWHTHTCDIVFIKFRAQNRNVLIFIKAHSIYHTGTIQLSLTVRVSPNASDLMKPFESLFTVDSGNGPNDALRLATDSCILVIKVRLTQIDGLL